MTNGLVRYTLSSIGLTLTTYSTVSINLCLILLPMLSRRVTSSIHISGPPMTTANGSPCAMPLSSFTCPQSIQEQLYTVFVTDAIPRRAQRPKRFCCHWNGHGQFITHAIEVSFRIIYRTRF